ncbi:MAG: META domain-containing protein [Anaerolineae bacterium]
MFTPLHTPEPASLQGTEWTLESFIEGDAVSSALAGTTLTLLLDDDGTYSGSAGCNTYGGTYTLQGEALTFGPPRMSRMMCAEDIMRQERSYLQLLESVAMFSLEGDQLILSTPSGEGLDFRQ